MSSSMRLGKRGADDLRETTPCVDREDKLVVLARCPAWPTEKSFEGSVGSFLTGRGIYETRGLSDPLRPNHGASNPKKKGVPRLIPIF